MNKKWQEYVEKFISDDSLELKVLKEGNLLEKDNRNILEHLLKARVSAEVLCDLLGLGEKEKDNVVSAATIHDSFVLEEKAYIRQKSKQKAGANYLDLQTIKAQSANRLREIGFPKEVIDLTDENITHEEGGPKSLPTKISFLVDAILSGPEIVDVPKRFDLTRRDWRSDLQVFDEETKMGNEKYWNDFFKGAPGYGD